MAGAWRLRGLGAFDSWSETDVEKRAEVLRWLADLVDDPDAVESDPVPDIPEGRRAFVGNAEIRYLRFDGWKILYLKRIETSGD